MDIQIIYMLLFKYIKKNCWALLTQLWVKNGKPSHWVKFFNYIFNPTFGFVHTVKPDELVQLKPFEETDCLKSFKFINSNNLKG